MSSIDYAVLSTLKDCINIRKNEIALILADNPQKELGQLFFEKALSISSNPHLLIIPEIPHYGYEPPKTVAAIMSKSDVIILLTSRSLSHSKARRKASNRGARIVSLPGVTQDCLMRTMTGNYKSIVGRSRKLADILTIGRSAHLTTPAGTDLTFSILRMKGFADTGIVHEPGQFSNLPAGEGCIAPSHGTTQGILIIDGSFPGIGRIKSPVRMTVKDGYVIRITGGEEVEKIRKLLRPFGKQGKNIAEIGIGTNPRAKLTGCTLEDEKLLGTVHVALGNNISFDGKIDINCHFDGVLLNPTLIIDRKTILENGVLQV
jgi:leucyl aminopeptidase (aminopeptidase T)